MQELKAATNSLKRNTAQCMTILVEQAKVFGLEYEDSTSRAQAASMEGFEMDSDDDFSEEIANNIKALWGNATIQQTYARRKEFWILDSAEYYFENVERFVEDDFVPSEEDQIMARVMTTGLVETEIPSPPITLTVVDVGGQRTERRKWIHCFDNVSGIVFCANLAGYNSVLFEDRTQNRMAECYQVFSETLNKDEFKNTPIFLLLNKKDLFESLMKKDPLNLCPVFADYTGASDVMEALKYIEAKFKAALTSNPERLIVYSVAARFKKDVKTCWEEVVQSLKTKNKKEIETCAKALEEKTKAA